MAKANKVLTPTCYYTGVEEWQKQCLESVAEEIDAVTLQRLRRDYLEILKYHFYKSKI